MEYLGEGFLYFYAIISNCRIWSSGAPVRSWEGLLSPVCHDWHSPYPDLLHCHCGANDDTHQDVPLLPIPQTRPFVPSIPYTIAAFLHTAHSHCSDNFRRSCRHLLCAWAEVGFPRFLLLLFHLHDNHWSGGLHSRGQSWPEGESGV